jgi:hypothetical protein
MEDFVSRVQRAYDAEAWKIAEEKEIDRISKLEDELADGRPDFAKSASAKIARALLEAETARREQADSAQVERQGLEDQLREIERQKEELLSRFRR